MNKKEIIDFLSKCGITSKEPESNYVIFRYKEFDFGYIAGQYLNWVSYIGIKNYQSVSIKLIDKSILTRAATDFISRCKEYEKNAKLVTLEKDFKNLEIV